MGSWLVRVEPGLGLRLSAASHHDCISGRASGGDGAASTGALAVPEPISALAVWGRTIYAAARTTASQTQTELLEIDARRPEAPVLVRRIARHRSTPERPPAPVVALDAIGTTLYLLTTEGLEIVETSEPGRAPERFPEITGRSIRSSGRLLRILQEDGSPAFYRDTWGGPLQYDVSVNEDFYSPQNLVIAIGDSVRWSNASGTSHNVVSCTTSQKGCEGAEATESFDSGDPALFFVFDHLFTQSGANPYVCEPHPYMTGSVTVLGSSGAPPGVPDGTTGSPMTVQRVTTDGSTLAIAWDTASCTGAADHDILYGYPYGFPPATGAGYEPAGSRCAIGTSSPFLWQNAPPAFPGASGLLWWLVVATDGGVTEGSWGRTSSGLERQGPGPGGASQECGVVAKSLTNACGQ
jgi:plastocyanin